MALSKIESDDIFISYRRSDGSTYTDGLAAELTKKGFSCFTDALGTDAGIDLPPKLIRKLKTCSLLVLVGTPDAEKSEAVAKEVKLFSEARGSSRIVLISFKPTIENPIWGEYVVGLRREPEDLNALVTGNPGPSIVNRVEKAFIYRRSKDRLRRYTITAGVTLASLIIAIGVAAFIAYSQIQKAGDALVKAENAQVEADKQTTRANEMTARSNEATRRAVVADSNAKQSLERLRNAEILADAASSRAAEATKKAVRQQKLATSLQLANESQVMLTNPDLISTSVSTAIESMEISHSLGTQLLASDLALRNSLSMLPKLEDTANYSSTPGTKKLFMITSPDGQPFLVESLDSSIRFYNAGHKTAFLELPCRKAGNVSFSYQSECIPRSVAISKNTKCIALGFDKLVRVYDSTHKSYKDFPIVQEKETINQIALSPDGRFLIAVIDDADIEGYFHEAELWDLEHNKGVSLLQRELMAVSSAAFNASGDAIMLGGTALDGKGLPSGLALIWGHPIVGDTLDESYFSNPVRLTQEEEIMGLAPGLDASHLATAQDTYITIWRQGTGGNYRPETYIPLRLAVTSISYDSAGKNLILMRNDHPDEAMFEDIAFTGHTEIWDPKGHRELARTAVPLRLDNIANIPHSSDLMALSAKDEGRLQLWKTHSELEEGNKFEIGLDLIVYESHDLEFLVVQGETPYVLRSDGLQKIEIVIDTVVKALHKASLTRDGRWLAIIGSNEAGEVSKGFLFELHNGAYRKRADFPAEISVRQISIKPDGSTVATVGDNGSIQIWNIKTGRLLHSQKVEKHKLPFDIQFSPQGHYFLVLDFPGGETNNNTSRIIVHDFQTGNERAWVQCTSLIKSFTWSRDGQYVAIGCQDGSIKLLQVTGNSLRVDIRDFSPVDVIKFSQSGRYFAAGTEAGSVRVFETASGNEVTRFSLGSMITGLAFREDDKVLYVASQDKDPYGLKDQTCFLSSFALSPLSLMEEAKQRLKSFQIAKSTK